MNELDDDTKIELTEGEKIKLTVESDGWRLIEDKLKEKIIDLQMIGNVVGSTADEKVKNMEARAMAVTMLFDWLKNDVHGRIEQFENNKSMVERKQQDESYIDRS